MWHLTKNYIKIAFIISNEDKKIQINYVRQIPETTFCKKQNYAANCKGKFMIIVKSWCKTMGFDFGSKKL